MDKERGLSARVYKKKHQVMITKLASKLSKDRGADVSEAQVVREAIEAKFMKEA